MKRFRRTNTTKTRLQYCHNKINSYARVNKGFQKAHLKNYNAPHHHVGKVYLNAKCGIHLVLIFAISCTSQLSDRRLSCEP